MNDLDTVVEIKSSELSSIIEDLGDTARRLESILSTLKFQVLSNADGVEESVGHLNGGSKPDVEQMIKKPIRRQIGNLKPATLTLENLVQRLGSKLENQNGIANPSLQPTE